MACIRRQLRWVVLKPTTVKRKKCPFAALKIPNNRKNAGFLKNQAMNIAVCILFLMNTAIVLKRRYKPNEFAKSQMTKLKFQTNLKIQWIKFKTYLDHWGLEFGYCPSTWLRVVSLSNHLLFVIWSLEFFQFKDSTRQAYPTRFIKPIWGYRH